MKNEHRYEAKAEEVFGAIVKFIKENPNQCKSDGYYFHVGKTYEFWVANGFGEHFRATSRPEFTSIPRELYTQKQCQLLQDAYLEWVEKSYKAPEIKVA